MFRRVGCGQGAEGWRKRGGAGGVGVPSKSETIVTFPSDFAAQKRFPEFWRRVQPRFKRRTVLGIELKPNLRVGQPF